MFSKRRVKALTKIVDDILLFFLFVFFYHFSEKIKLGISCESSANSHEMSSLTVSEKYKKKKKKMSSAAFMISFVIISLRVNRGQFLAQIMIHKLIWIFFVIRKTYLYNFDTHKPHFYIVKLGFTGVCIIFLISAHKHRLWVLVRAASVRQF